MTDTTQQNQLITRIATRPTAARKPLAQLRPANTNNTSAYAPRSGTLGVVTNIFVCNTTGGALTFRLFMDFDGSTFDESTAIYYGKSVAANDTFPVPITSEHGLALRAGGSFGVQSSSASGLTFTFIGYEELGTQ